MTRDLDIRNFFRKAPREFLRRYFAQYGGLLEFDWASLTIRNINPLHEAWLLLADELQLRMIADFRDIDLLSNATGKLAIIDEAAFHDDLASVTSEMAKLDDFYAYAFWTFLERPHLWEGAIFFAVADAKQRRYWRKRINMPVLGRKPTDADGKALGDAIAKLFMQLEGRAKYCDVHQYRRGDREYFFAYPQDHQNTSVEYDDRGEWTKRRHNPAFEIIFVHDDKERTLNIWHLGKSERVNDLQVIFAQTVLGTDIPRKSPKDSRVYELSAFLGSDFRFELSEALGIKSASVRKICMQVLGPQNYAVRIDLGAGCPDDALYDRLEAAMVDIPRSMLRSSASRHHGRVRTGRRREAEPNPYF